MTAEAEPISRMFHVEHFSYCSVRTDLYFLSRYLIELDEVRTKSSARWEGPIFCVGDVGLVAHISAKSITTHGCDGGENNVGSSFLALVARSRPLSSRRRK